MEKVNISVMDRDECVRILEEYNQWRRGGDGDQPSPTIIGIAIDHAIDLLKEQCEYRNC